MCLWSCLYGDCGCLHVCMHVCERVRLYGGCVAFVCVSGHVCMVIVCVCVDVCMFVNAFVLYCDCVVFACVFFQIVSCTISFHMLFSACFTTTMSFPTMI